MATAATAAQHIDVGNCKVLSNFGFATCEAGVSAIAWALGACRRTTFAVQGGDKLVYRAAMNLHLANLEEKL
jgi:hypothetical protein